MSKNSFLTGMSRSVDIGSTINRRKQNIPKSVKMSDSYLIGEDWNAVGKEIRRATDGYGKQIRNRLAVTSK